MNRRDREFRSSILKLIGFAVVAIMVIATVAATIRPFSSGGSATYKAVFTNASRLKPGDDVRAAGVAVGRVDQVDLRSDDDVTVTFTLDQPVSLTTGSRAEIHFLDLIGDRALSLLQGPGSTLRPGSTIPVSQTSPALDLNALFNGFKPLFAALSPADINALSMDIIETLQGEGTTVTSILQNTALVTKTVADRDQMVGRVIDNLNTVLGTLSDRQDRVNDLVTQLTRFLSGAAEDRATIGNAITQVSHLTDQTAGLLQQARPGLAADVNQLNTLSQTLSKPANLALLDHLMTFFPGKLAAIARTASNGSWFNYYACQINVRVSGAASPGTSTLAPTQSALLSLVSLGVISLSDTTARCH